MTDEFNGNFEHELQFPEGKKRHVVGKRTTKRAEKVAGFRRIRLPKRHQREAAQLALRIMTSHARNGELLRRGYIVDDDILKLIALEQTDDNIKLSTAGLRKLVAIQLAHVDKPCWPRNDVMQRNIEQIGDMLRLNLCERRIFRFAFVSSSEYFSELLCHFMNDSRELHGVVATATNQSLLRVRVALRADGTLRQCGFFKNNNLCFEKRNPLALSARFADTLRSPCFDPREFFRRIVRAAPKPNLALDDYSHVPELATVLSYFRGLGLQRRKGVNVLIYGEPGTGKTEYARALAAEVGRDLYEVPNVDEDDDAISGQSRFGAYAACQRILVSRCGQMVLFDEVEDVFGTGSDFGALFGLRNGHDAEGLRKSWVNEMLESNPVPTIWVCNSIGALDKAYLRRFDLVVEMPAPNKKVRRRIIDRYFRAGEISDACAERIADIEGLPPAQIERAARVLRCMKCRTVKQRDAEVLQIMEGPLRAMGIESKLRLVPLPSYYDPAYIHTDADLKAITKGIVLSGSARICLYGPPGTGKTAFAHHLGKLIDRPVLLKRGSDLLGKFVGQTEEQIAKAFRQARDDKAILVIDEADGFLRDRSSAQHSWEVTHVNELLTQMEAFDGIFVASTNLMDLLDAASLRRFDFKLKFDYLDRDQRRALLAKACSASVQPIVQSTWAALDRLDAITPGDVTNALRQCKVTCREPTVEIVVKLLAAEQALKPECRGRPIGFTP